MFHLPVLLYEFIFAIVLPVVKITKTLTKPNKYIFKNSIFIPP
nr:MAG TPA: hypothetical protein [Caudoviricetes sp.]DAY35576.1 MAG TPA: hypothetical protein [Caudoviricetes sp.]